MAKTLPGLKHWHYHIDFEKIAWATFDQAGESTNTFGRETATELDTIVTAVEEAAKRGEARALIFLSGKDKAFIAGADISEFDNLTREKDVEDAVRQLTAVFDRIETMPIPVIAAIHGYCLGGGLEFAMACHYRIATRSEETRLGLPEVRLGIIPRPQRHRPLARALRPARGYARHAGRQDAAPQCGARHGPRRSARAKQAGIALGSPPGSACRSANPRARPGGSGC